MPIMDDINRILRDNERYLGNGGTTPLPIGDRSSGARPIIKRDLRELFRLIAEVTGAPDTIGALSEQIYASRSSAVTGAQLLSSTVSHLANRNGTTLEIRQRTASADDPLFASGDRWGVVMRQDSAAEAAARAAAIAEEATARNDAIAAEAAARTSAINSEAAARVAGDAAVTNVIADIKSAPEDLTGRTAIITDSAGRLVMGAGNDGLDFIPSQALKDRILDGTGEFAVQSGLEIDALMIDASGRAVIATKDDGLDFQPSGRMSARLMDSARFPGVPANSGIIATSAAGRTIFRHGALGPRDTTYAVSNAGAPVVQSTRSIAITPYGQSNADTQGDPVSVADKWPAHVYVPNDGLYHYGPLNNNEQLVNLNGMTGFIPTNTVAAGKASYAVPAAMVVANRLPQNVRMIVRACGRPSRAMVADNGILYNLDGTTFSNNFLNFVATALRVIELSIADGSPIDQLYVPFTHQENDKDTPAATYAAYLNTLITEFNGRVRAVYPAMKIRWMLDELAGWSDLGNAFEVRKALLTVADARPADVTLVGPRYPYGLLDTIHHSGLGRVRYGALLGEAIAALEQGQSWQAPRMSAVSRVGTVIAVDWTSALPIVLDQFAMPYYESVLGFSLSGIDNGATIQSVTQTGPRTITVTLSATPTGAAMRLRYAWRAPVSTSPTLTAGRPFGNGGVRDEFDVPNIMLTGEKVKRFAIGFDAAI